MPSPRAASPRATRLALAWFALSAALLVWPLYPWLGNRVEPRVLGLPWSLVYILLVVVADAAALLLLYCARAIDGAEADDDV